MDPLTSLPSELRAGTTLEYTRTLPDFPASLWTMELVLRGVSMLSKIATEIGDSFVIEITPEESRDLLPGNYQAMELVTEKATQKRYEASIGWVNVLRDLHAAGAGEAQTWEEKTLVIIEAVLQGRATSDMQAYTIGNRSVTKIPVVELIQWRERLRAAVRAQRGGSQTIGEVQVQFKTSLRP